MPLDRGSERDSRFVSGANALNRGWPVTEHRRVVPNAAIAMAGHALQLRSMVMLLDERIATFVWPIFFRDHTIRRK